MNADPPSQDSDDASRALSGGLIGDGVDVPRAETEGRDTRLVLVTGISGAGHSTALKTFEDMGFEAVDNLPLSLLQMVLRGRDMNAPRLAIGVDARTHGFSTGALRAALAELRRGDPQDVFLLFLDCRDDVLIRRFTETRRRHPLATDRPVIDGITRERELLCPLLDCADWVIDTSQLPPADLRTLLRNRFATRAEPGLTLTVLSFSYRFGVPREADLVFDTRFLRNPHYVPDLEPHDGRDPRVAAYVAEDPDFPAFFDRLWDLVWPLLPRFRAEGKSYLTIAFGCTGGKHRSVFLAEALTHRLAEHGLQASVRHRDLGRTGDAGS